LWPIAPQDGAPTIEAGVSESQRKPRTLAPRHAVAASIVVAAIVPVSMAGNLAFQRGPSALVEASQGAIERRLANELEPASSANGIETRADSISERGPTTFASPSDPAAQSGHIAQIDPEPLSRTSPLSMDDASLPDQNPDTAPTLAALAPASSAVAHSVLTSQPVPPKRPATLVSKSVGGKSGAKPARTRVAMATSGAKEPRHRSSTPVSLARSAVSSLEKVAQGIGKIPYRVSLLFK
jgi:hypothetical protein